MNKKSILTAAIAAGFVATPAMAQDGTQSGGFSIGGLAGIDSVTGEFGGESDSEEDFLYGATLGWDLVTANGLLLGTEVEWADSSHRYTEDDVVVLGDSVTVAAGRDIYVGGRLGYDLGNVRLYTKAGYSNAKVEGSYFDGTTTFADSTTLDGWRAGAGIEVPVGQNFAIRAEYRYSDYGEVVLDGFATGLKISRNQGAVFLLGKF
ncbi:outer membrane protein [Qipengyuania sp. CAU 1752]